MFLVNSHNPRFSATSRRSEGKPLHANRHTFSRSYGVILPSSLGWVLSSALGSSPRPPVSVCGTVTTAVNSTGAFLGSWESSSLWAQAPSSSPLEVDPPFVALGLLMGPSTGLNRYPISGSTAFLRPSCRNYPSWFRTINLIPISYAFLPHLRDRLTLGRLT